MAARTTVLPAEIRRFRLRIDKLLSECAVAPRREAAGVARRGGVLCNGEPVRDLSRHIDPERDKITYLGREVVYRPFTFVMLNKPTGYVSATDDPGLPTVMELLPPEHKKMGLFPVGRLDRDTTGLMLLTNDGALAHSLLSPKKHVEKVYSFTCAEPLREGAEDMFRGGVTLGDGYECRSAVLTLTGDRTSGTVTLTEGKYHQIKRMMGAVGNRITSLCRISFGGIELDRSLPPGGWRYLTAEEENILRSERK